MNDMDIAKNALDVAITRAQHSGLSPAEALKAVQDGLTLAASFAKNLSPVNFVSSHTDHFSPRLNDSVTGDDYKLVMPWRVMASLDSHDPPCPGGCKEDDHHKVYYLVLCDTTLARKTYQIALCHMLESAQYIATSLNGEISNH